MSALLRLGALVTALVASPALAASEETATPGSHGGSELFWPIEMMVDAAAEAEDEALALPEATDATPGERAFALMQMSRYGEARAIAAPLAEQGDGPMAGLLARLYAEGLGVPRDDAKAVEWLLRAAEVGDAGARHELAIRRFGGNGVPRDESAAMRDLRVLATEGRPDAAHDLAQVLLGIDRTEDERAEGTRLLRTAARGGITDAQYALARKLMAEGSGNAEALEWLVEAARNGMAEAQLELGLWLISGTAGRRDLDAAFGWVERAALAGLPLAKQRLAQMHWRGLGTPGDRIAAARWHALARMDGLIDHELDAMLVGLDDDEIERAMRGLPAALRDLPEEITSAPRRIVLGAERRGRTATLPGVDLGERNDPYGAVEATAREP